ncbi:hypothetical protein Ancab_015521 [Ancistrocladus abbreviatus]
MMASSSSKACSVVSGHISSTKDVLCLEASGPSLKDAKYSSERWAHDFRPISNRLIKRLRKGGSGIRLGSRNIKKNSVGRPTLRESNASNDAEAQSNPSEQ